MSSFAFAFASNVRSAPASPGSQPETASATAPGEAVSTPPGAAETARVGTPRQAGPAAPAARRHGDAQPEGGG